MELKNYSSTLNKVPKQTLPPQIQTGQAQTTIKQVQTERTGQPNKFTFQDLLYQEVNRQQEVKLSVHAEKRLKERNISLSNTDFDKISKAVQQAAAKGSKDTLLLYGDLAMIASVPNRTVVTAMDGKNMEDHIFTNIDSAVIIK